MPPPAPAWAGSHAASIPTSVDDYVFFLSKEEVPYGCFSNAYRERNPHRASAAESDRAAASPDAAPASFWCINQELHYRKAVLFGDRDTAARILAEKDDAGAIKALGRLVKDYDDARWREARYGACRDAVRAKFAQDPELRAVLLGTGSRIIVEAARDRAWGIGVREYASSSDDGEVVRGAKDEGTGGWDVLPEEWEGENLLGRCLMDVREELAAGGD